MTMLALEFSSAQRSAAVWRAGSVSEAIESGGRGTNAFGLITKALAGAGIEREQIEVIAVGLGPGSYTGIRVAVSIAQGWQLARGVKLLGVSGAECLAAQAQAEKIFGRVNVVIDAQRREFYLATWEISETERRQIAALKIVPAAEIQARKEAGEICVGPAAGNVLYPRAATILRLAAGRNDFVSGEKLAPIYLRETSFVKAPPARVF
jgi:tRNA threonylcarbamoyladenosine biosynthesis protein TsaB